MKSRPKSVNFFAYDIIQLADGRQFILSAIDDFDIEIVQKRQNQKLMTFLDQRAKQTQAIPLDEVKR